MLQTSFKTRGRLRRFSREELLAAIEQGSRCVTFGYCFSLLLITVHGETDVQVVRGRADGVLTGLGYTLGTALFGWWSIHGIFLTPYYLARNVIGGRDVTQQVLATLQSAALSNLLVGSDFGRFEQPEPQPEQAPLDFLSDLEARDRTRAS